MTLPALESASNVGHCAVKVSNFGPHLTPALTHRERSEERRRTSDQTRMNEAQRASASKLGQLYERVYATLCGKHPDVWPWHFRYLLLRDTHAWQRWQMS